MKNKDNHVILQYTKAMLDNQGKTNFSNSIKTVSHDQLTRTMSKEYPWQTLLWNFITMFINLAEGHLILDDTVINKPHSQVDTSLRKFIRYVWSNKDQKVVVGINVVFLLLVVGNLRIPLGFRLYDKTQTKIELALDLLSEARNVYRFRKVMVLFDSWYASRRILHRIHDYGWVFVSRIKKSRKVSGLAVKELIPHPYGNCTGDLNGIRVRLVRHLKHYLIFNRVGYDAVAIRKWYEKRSVVEHFFKDLKTYFHANDCQSRTKAAWINHLNVCRLCFLIVELKSVDLGETVCHTKRNRISRSYRFYLDYWERLLATT